jgi:hydroxymethylglutaryl-CoA reductase
MATKERIPVPRDRENDYTHDAARARREFARDHTGADLEHVGAYSFDPAVLTGNVEHFLGVAQVPIGLAGPLLVDGEHAQGEFYVPLATAEGTLVASYNRGMRLIYEAGGVKTTIMADRMQRAPVFIMPSATGWRAAQLRGCAGGGRSRCSRTARRSGRTCRRCALRPGLGWPLTGAAFAANASTTKK